MFSFVKFPSVIKNEPQDIDNLWQLLFKITKRNVWSISYIVTREYQYFCFRYIN